MKSAARWRHREPRKIFEVRPPRGKRVLVVEDDAMICMMLQDMLAELGYMIAAEAARIDGALEVLRTGESVSEAKRSRRWRKRSLPAALLSCSPPATPSATCQSSIATDRCWRSHSGSTPSSACCRA